MKKANGQTANKKNAKRVLDKVALNYQAPFWAFIILVVIYIISSVVVSTVARSQDVLVIGESELHVSAFAGVISSLGNIVVIFMVLYYGKLSFYSALALLLAQFPAWLINVILHHNLSILPGLFLNLFTIVAIFLLHLNNERINKYQLYLRNQAVTDMLTGLPNRFACSEVLGDLMKHNGKFVVATIDLNNFKSINSTLGFQAGNAALKEIASRWQKIADTGISGTLDFVARLAGDEFALIIQDYRSDKGILNTIRQYEAALGNRLTIENCDFYITASFGYAEYPTDAQNINDLFSYADAAMSEVKRINSSNHIMRFIPELVKEERTLEIERKLRKALDDDTIYFNLQPQYDTAHRLRGFESLARMKDEDGNIVSPSEFIPVAEKVGLVDKVDGTVFKKSAAFFGQLLKSSGADITLSVNISVRHLMKNDFLEEVVDVLKTNGIPANQLEIEITESIMIDSAEKALHCIEKIKQLGVQIAIDDFGTGYSSLSYLNSFPANLLKIDKSFIDSMNTSDSSKQYVAAIISIGHIMGFEVISEGVEEEEQLETLREIGCDFIQCFIWGRSLAMEEAQKIVMASMGR